MSILKRFIAVTALACFVVVSKATAQPNIIVNTGVSDPRLDRARVRAIFYGAELRWSNGAVPVVYILPPDNPTSKAFAWEVLGIAPYEFEERVKNFGPNRVRVLQSELEMAKMVSSTPNSIGFLSQLYIVHLKNGYRFYEIHLAPAQVILR